MNKRTWNATSVPIAMGWGVLVSMLATLLCCAAFAAMISLEWMEEGSVGYGSLLILVLASMAGAMTGGVMSKGKYMPVCMGCGLAYYIGLLCCTGLFFDGAYTGLLPSGAAILGGSGAVALLMARKSGSQKRHKWKYKPV